MKENENKNTETETFCEQNKSAIANFATSYYRQGIITMMTVMASTFASAAVINKIFNAIRMRKKEINRSKDWSLEMGSFLFYF